LEEHKLIFSTLFTFRVLMREGQLDPAELDHMMVGRIDQNIPLMSDQARSFLSEATWTLCKSLEALPAFYGFTQQVEANILQWKKWYNEERAELVDISKIFKELSRFQKLLLFQALRPDRLTSALQLFIKVEMGERFVEQPAFSLATSLSQLSKATPLFFVLFPGVDPTQELEDVAQQFDIRTSNGRLVNISMGQG